MFRKRAPIVLAAAALLLQVVAARGAPLRVGSKNFTESLVVAEIVRLEAQKHGIAMEHSRALGGTRILWRALEEGSIDLYPEYTGTLATELLQIDAAAASLDDIRAALAARGIVMSEPLGFDNSYALGMLNEAARRDSITTISDLQSRSDLRFGLSNEFIDRADGWPGLSRRYGLRQQAKGLDHDLAYRALAGGSADVIDLYTTDAEIPYYRIRVLTDDRHYFPTYRAVLLVRRPALDATPALRAVLDALAGRIDTDAMRTLNGEVKLAHRTETDVAAAFTGVASTRNDRDSRVHRILQRTWEHVLLVSISLGLAIVLALPLGVAAARYRKLGAGILAICGILQTVPSLAMFVFMIPLFGIGAKPAIAALFLYSLLPVVRNTHAGLSEIPLDLRESASALGLPQRPRLFRIELPLARPSILAGIKTAAVINVGTASLGALIGAGGYGEPIVTGIRLDDLGLILEGAIPAAALALLVQGGFGLVERALSPKGLRRRRETDSLPARVA